MKTLRLCLAFAFVFSATLDFKHPPTVIDPGGEATHRHRKGLSGAWSQGAAPLSDASRQRLTGLSVRSVPEGAEVYVATIEELELGVKEMEGDAMVRRFAGIARLKIADREDFWAMTAKIDKIMSPRFHKGKVPVTLEVPPGTYVVLVTSPPSVPNPLDARFEVASVHGLTFTMSRTNASGEKVGGVVSSVEVIAGENNLLVQLWHPEKMTLSEVEKFYPAKETFTVPEEALTKSLAQQKMKVKEADIPTMLRLLRKGGKLVYRKGEERLVIQVNSSSEESLWIVRYKD